MADWNTPTNASAYTGVLSTLNEKIANAAKMDYGSDTNLPVGAIRFNTTTGGIERWSGSAWVAQNAPTSWTPSYGASGSMTFTGVTTNVAQTARFGSVVAFHINASGTTGGTASVALTFSFPFTAAASPSGIATYVYDPATLIAGVTYVSGATGYVSRYDGANWGLGAARSFGVSGILFV